MRVAFFSPLPPARSGIADYSEALLAELKKLAEVDVFTSAGGFTPGKHDVCLYQIGNNEYHEFCYDMALRNPGVAVLHEANLHHLVAGLTIARGNWDAYLREVEFDGGQTALEYAQEFVRSLKRGPDYQGVPMLRRLLQASRGVIVHSGCVEAEARKAAYQGPVARIPHGAWIPEADRMGARQRLGVGEDEPLIGVFGFLKPYKRIAESLRAFRRLIRVAPGAKMILVGEAHPQLPIDSTIDSLGLAAHVRRLDFTPIEEFVNCIAACDVVLNLRHPTVGENSGTLMRALGLGRAVIVSDNGSFRELPDEICLKTPVDASEEDTLFEYMNLLVSRPDLARDMGERAHEWVARECNWKSVAKRYAEFLEAVAAGTAEIRIAPVREEPPEPPLRADVNYIRGWAINPESREYIETHLTRFEKTLAITPRGGPEDRALEMGAYLQITPSLRAQLGYGEVRGCYYGPAGTTHRRRIVSQPGEEFVCDVDLFNAEKDLYPYADGYFTTVLCCELIEHLAEDPMHLMSEVNRILKHGGSLVLTTPNITSLRAIAAILQGFHPGFFPAYIRPPEKGGEPEARHHREYAPREIEMLLRDAGFEVTLLETGEFRDAPHPEHRWVESLMKRYLLPEELRGDGIYAVGRKIGPVVERHPAWLYQ